MFQQPTDVPYQVQVCNPQKQTDKSRAYVAYTLKVRKVKDGVESSSFRRFSDFLWIHDQLEQKHPTCVIPPMPAKSLSLSHTTPHHTTRTLCTRCDALFFVMNATTAGKFSAELLMFRSRELTRFVQRVAAHPVLAEDEDFEFFLMAPWTDFSEKRAATPAKESVVGSWFSSIKSALPFGGKGEDPDEWFVATAADLAARKELVEELQESSAGMVSGWRELTQLYGTQAQQMRALSKFFGDTEASRCAEDAAATEANVKVVEELATQIEHSYADNLGDYLREIAAIEAVLERRMALVREYNSLAKVAEKKGAEALAKRDEALAALDAFSKPARADIQRVLDTRKGELERIVVGFAQVHRDCFTQTASSWTSALQASGCVAPASAGSAAATSSSTSTTTTTAETVTSLNNEESVGPFSSAVVDGVPASPYAIDD